MGPPHSPTDINRRWFFSLHSFLLKDEISDTPQTSLQEQCGEFGTPPRQAGGRVFAAAVFVCVCVREVGLLLQVVRECVCVCV